jgi:hypothetical protein
MAVGGMRNSVKIKDEKIWQDASIKENLEVY